MLKFLTTHSSPIIFLIAVIAVCCLTTVRSEYDSSAIGLVTDVDVDNPTSATDPCSGTAAAIPGSCPVKCFRTDPVCGVNGVTYWCGCAEAMCAGTRVAKLGFCEVGSGGSAPLSGQALLLVHIVWLIALGFSVLFGLF